MGHGQGQQTVTTSVAPATPSIAYARPRRRLHGMSACCPCPRFKPTNGAGLGGLIESIDTEEDEEAGKEFERVSSDFSYLKTSDGWK